MFKSVRVVTCATTNAMEAAQYFVDTFGLKIRKTLTVPEHGFNNAIVDIGDVALEFIEPIDKNEKPINNFLKKRGPGLYLLELEVENLEDAVEKLKKKGLKLMDDDPETRKTRGVFIHPSSAKGLLLYITQTGT